MNWPVFAQAVGVVAGGAAILGGWFWCVDRLVGDRSRLDVILMPLLIYAPFLIALVYLGLMNGMACLWRVDG